MVKQFLHINMALVLLFFSDFYPESIYAQAFCDPTLNISSVDPLHYRPRGTPPNRCEGRYVEEVSGTILLLASLTEFFEEIDPHSGKDLLIEWSIPPHGKSLHLRAQGIRDTKPQLFYRMDTEHPLSIGMYVWNPGLLDSLNILRQDIGVVGWTEFQIGNAIKEVYIPTRISQQTQATKTGKYQFVIFPGVELSEIYVSFAKTEGDGTVKSFITSDVPLRYGDYPAEKGVSFTISKLQESGVYYVEIGVMMRSGGTESIQFYFYHNG